MITGANRGIGLELVRQYAVDGWNVLACCRSPENAHDLNKLAAASAGNVTVLLLLSFSAWSLRRIPFFPSTGAITARGHPDNLFC
jgi:NAD(P)-dependent dehydrogenase (short-subunit alcohol dehydrogenase family)